MIDFYIKKIQNQANTRKNPEKFINNLQKNAFKNKKHFKEKKQLKLVLYNLSTNVEKQY